MVCISAIPVLYWDIILFNHDDCDVYSDIVLFKFYIWFGILFIVVCFCNNSWYWLYKSINWDIL